MKPCKFKVWTIW